MTFMIMIHKIGMDFLRVQNNKRMKYNWKSKRSYQRPITIIGMSRAVLMIAQRITVCFKITTLRRFEHLYNIYTAMDRWYFCRDF